MFKIPSQKGCVRAIYSQFHFVSDQAGALAIASVFRTRQSSLRENESLEPLRGKTEDMQWANGVGVVVASCLHYVVHGIAVAWWSSDGIRSTVTAVMSSR